MKWLSETIVKAKIAANELTDDDILKNTKTLPYTILLTVDITNKALNASNVTTSFGGATKIETNQRTGELVMAEGISNGHRWQMHRIDTVHNDQIRIETASRWDIEGEIVFDGRIYKVTGVHTNEGGYQTCKDGGCSMM